VVVEPRHTPLALIAVFGPLAPMGGGGVCMMRLPVDMARLAVAKEGEVRASLRGHQPSERGRRTVPGGREEGPVLEEDVLGVSLEALGVLVLREDPRVSEGCLDEVVVY
jgi:hypothetical protein